MGDVPSKEGQRVGGVKKTRYGRLKKVHFPFILIKTSTKGNLAICGHVELIFGSDGVLWGDRWVTCYPKRVIG